MVAAAQSALEANTVIAADGGDTDEGAIVTGRQLGAGAVVRVLFQDGVAQIRVHLDGPNPWAEDAIRFSESDDPPERGRTIGYAIASMVSHLEVQRERPAPPPPPPPPPRAPARPRPDGDVLVSAGLAIDGAIWGTGPVVGGRWWALGSWGLGADVGARFGRSAEADASVQTYSFALGPSARRDLGPLELEGHVRVGALRHVVSRTEGDATRARWLGATNVTIEGALPLGAAAAVVVGTGVEVGWGTTPIKVGSAQVGELPPVRWVSAIGGRYRF